ncbi:hypothetical protein NMG60_11025608 [Bertholletia excelsa]
MHAAIASSGRSNSALNLLKYKSSSNHPLLPRHFSAEPHLHHREKPSPPSQENSTVTSRVLSLLQGNENEWGNNEELRQILLTSNTEETLSSLHLYRITRNLGTSSKALNFFEFIRANSPSPPEMSSLSSAFQAILELASHEKSDSATKLSVLFNISTEQRIPLTAHSATLLIRCFAGAGMVEKSLLVYKMMDPDSRNTHTSNALLKVLLRAGHVDDALQLVDEMLKKDSCSPPNEDTLNIVMSALLSKDRIGRAVIDEEIVGIVSKFSEHGVFPSAVRLTQLITKLCRSGRIDTAWDVFHDLMKLGGEVQAPPCNAILTGLGRQQQFQKMNELMAEMKENGIQPDVVTYGILINHLCKFHRVDEALEVFEKMNGESESGGFAVKPDTIIYNTLIDGLCKVGRQEQGLDLMGKMRLQQGCVPNTVTYNCLIDGFCKTGEIEKGHELLDQMIREGVPPNMITLNTLVNGMCKHGQVRSAMAFFHEMQEKGLQGNAVTYTVLIQAFCNVNNIDKAMDLFNEMCKIGISPDAIVYYSLISGLTNAGRPDDASSVASSMKKAGFCLDVASYNSLIGGFCRKNKLDKAYDMLVEMEQVGVKPDGITYNTLISYFSKRGNFKTASNLMKKMIGEGLNPTVVTYGALIHAYCLANRVDEAMKIFRDMSSSSSSRVPPNSVIYNILIDSLCKCGKVDEALDLLNDMRNKGVRPTTNTYNAMFKGLQEKKWLDKAFELMDQMTEQACNPDYITMEILTNWLSAVGETEKLRSFTQGYQVSASAA